eukprot:jgi/Tetstr1/443295/TSEL_000266.t1
MSHADVLSAVMEKGGPTPEYRNFVEFCSHFESASDPRVATSVERSVAVRKVSMAELQEGSLIKDGRPSDAVLSEPFVVTDAMVGQPAMRWTLDALQRDFGNEAVLVNNRAPARRADAKVGPPQRSMQVQLSDYIGYINGRPSPFSSPPESAPFYLNGWHGPSQMKQLRDDFPVFEFLKHIDTTECILKEMNTRIFGAISKGSGAGADWWSDMNRKLDKIFMGPAGTCTRLHYDAADAHGWLSQIEGSKLFVLFHPDDTPNLYKLAGETHTQQSEVDPLDPLNASKYPLYNNARPFSCVVATGEAVFIPKGWWHYAVALEPSVTVQRNFYSVSNAASLIAMIFESFQRLKQEQVAKAAMKSAQG